MKINFQTLNVFSKYNVKKVNNNNNFNFVSLNMSNPIKADTFERQTPPSLLVAFEGNNKPQVNKNGEQREITDFAVKNIHNIECPVCEKITMDYKDIDEYVANVADKKGQELVDAIDKYGDEYYWTADPTSKGKTVYRENVEAILEVIKKLAVENPDANLKGLVTIASKDTMPELIGKQLNVLSEINAYAMVNIKKAERENIFKLTDRHRNLILDRVPDRNFKRKTFIKELSNVQVANLDKKREMLEIAKKLPASTNDGSSFFAKYAKDSNRNCKEIAGRFVMENRPTGEHIDCFSNGGASDKNNYFMDCAYCNSKRGDTPFNIWAKTIPNFQENLQKYLEVVQQNVDNHTLPRDYKNYAKNIIGVINSQSGGKIKLIDPYESRKLKNEEFAARAQQKLDAKKEEIKQLLEDLAYLKEQAAISYSESAKLNNQLKVAETKEEKKELKEKIRKCEARQDELKSLIAAVKADMWSLKE